MQAYNSGQQILALGHSRGHIDCPACAKACELTYKQLSPDLPYPEAFELWISHHDISPEFENGPRILSPKTIRDYRNCHSALTRFFGRLKLGQVHAGHLREYQRMRALNPPDPNGQWWCVRANRAHGPLPTREAAIQWSEQHGGEYELRQTVWAGKAGANRIRKEVAMLLQILRAAKCWGESEQLCFKPLRAVESDVRRAMDETEERKLLMVASSRAEWHLIYYYSLLALRTTCSTNELRSLRLSDISLTSGFLQIRREGAKCRGRMRTIPIETPDLVCALEWLMDRARQLGAAAPYHYLFPLGVKRFEYDPSRPMTESGLKKKWEAVRSAADLDWLRLYDLRHTAITRMAEAGTPIQVIMSFAGHLTLRMQQHYTTISMMARRKTAQLVWGHPAPPKFGPYAEGNQDMHRYIGHA